MSNQSQNAKQSVSIDEYSEEEITDEEVQALLDEVLYDDDDPLLPPRARYVFYHRRQLRGFIDTMTRLNADMNLPPPPPIETAIREERPGERHPHRYIYYMR